MPKYRVTMFFTASKTVEVEAETAEDAIEKAENEKSYVSLCHQCAREVDDGLEISGEVGPVAELIDESEGDK